MSNPTNSNQNEPGPLRAFVVTWLLSMLAAVGAIYLALYHHWRYDGLEHVPNRGPLLLTPNHLSVLDIPVVGIALIFKGYRPGVNFFTVTKQEVFHNPILTPIFRLIGLFPIDRSRMDLDAMRAMLAILKRGHILGIAPEGTRSPTAHLQLFQPSVAKLAISHRVPILPIGVSGMDKAVPIGARFPRPEQIAVTFGEVYELSDYYDRPLTPADLTRAAWEMRAHVAALLPDWMRDLPPEDAEARFGGVRQRATEKVL